jgi:hypothetical protein
LSYTPSRLPGFFLVDIKKRKHSYFSSVILFTQSRNDENPTCSKLFYANRTAHNMNTRRQFKTTEMNSRVIGGVFLAGLLLAAAPRLDSQVDKTWVSDGPLTGGNGNWGADASWDPSGRPGAEAATVFTGPANASINLGSFNPAIQGMTISKTGSTNFWANITSGSRNLTFGSGGLTIHEGAGGGSFTLRVNARVTATQVWQNESVLNVNSRIDALNTPTLTITGAGDTLVPSRIGHPTAGQRVNALIKSGEGTLTTGDVYSETGITVEGGTYLLNGRQFDVNNDRASVVTVNPGGTLGGTGTLQGPVSVSGNLQPGSNGIGLLTFDYSLDLQATAVTRLEIAGVTERGVSHDAIDVVLLDDGLTFGGDLELVFIGAAESGEYTLFEFAGAARGGFANVTVAGWYTGSLAQVDAGIWSGDANGASFTFSEHSGDMTVVAPPVVAAPALVIQTSNSEQVRLSWPSSALGWTLQSATEIDGDFTQSDLPVSVEGDENAAYDTIAEPKQFYRLTR